MIPYGRHYIDEDDVEAVAKLLREGHLTQGPMVDAFEDAITQYTGAKYAVAVSSATAGLHLAALTAGIEPGYCGITSPITFVATANAVTYAGGRTIFADIDPQTANISATAFQEAAEKHPETKVVFPVHFSGQPCDMVAIQEIARAKDIRVIEDAAHALGGTYETGQKIGSNAFADMTVFSFHPVKTVAAGEGGVVTTNDEDFYRHLLRLRSHGINKMDDAFQIPSQAFEDGMPNPWYYEMQELGFHYRITDIQCALAISQLKKLDRFIERRRSLVEVYDSAFVDLELVRPAQSKPRRDLSGHHLYVVRIDFERLGLSRGEVMRRLKAKGVGSQVHYIPVTSHPFYQALGHRTDQFPATSAYYKEALSIPLFFGLTDEQQEHVIETIKEVVG